jgi:hypothetical protein
LRLQYTGETMNPDGMVALLNYRVSSIQASLHTSNNPHFRRMVSRVSGENACHFGALTSLQPILRSGSMA